MSKLTVKYLSRYEVSFQDLEDMHRIFRKYYTSTELKSFKNDFDKKSGVFILRKKSTGDIVGFSTLLEMNMIVNGKKVRGVFSGDTIVEEEYWGKNPLNAAFVCFYLKRLLANPFKPVYWFLISKGYKTYLLLANNFLSYYPCHNKENKHLEDVMKGYCRYLFSGFFDENKKILDFGHGSQCLRNGIADITGEMCEKHPKIAFFKEKNPNWKKGTELPCVGVVTWGTILHRICVKPLKKQVSKLSVFLYPGEHDYHVSSLRKATP